MNSKISISVPCSVIDWLKLLRLYFAAFPRAERKPFSRIYNMYRRGKSDIWCIRRGGVFAGFATTVNSPDVILLDYLAISSDHRGEGIGSAAMVFLKINIKAKAFLLRSRARLKTARIRMPERNDASSISTAGWSR